ncbi:hypothetical protein BJ138DRAFT_1117919 [Hygrophoropsis aurantiaca]|uniref:Uncharacterized protein n=1 Tax=Hygrophoropsis aurantiaca TaxID=72124 RepID=A0ACB7ZYP2_9AGAM|nr:hypothetical protein BJ138DRAFT_1117919 [Hygrophoropsis aurantiaca]
MFISRILSLVTFSMFVAAACNGDEDSTQNPSDGYDCVNPSGGCPPPRRFNCCYGVNGTQAFGCEDLL